MGTFLAVSLPPAAPRALGVLAVSSNKGGVGKTTLATNLAIYMRAVREELPVAVVGLDDQRVIDRMFALREQDPLEGNLKHGWAQRSLDGVIQLGQYGVHFVPSPPEVGLLKVRAEDPKTLSRILHNTDWEGVIVLDTKSDFETLTRNAWHAADRVLVPVADRSSLDEAAKLFGLFERAQLPFSRLRIVLTLADRRTRSGTRPLVEQLEEEVARRGWPRYETTLSRSPRVEALISGSGRPLSILHHARGTALHGEMLELTREVLRDLEGLPGAGADGEPAVLWGRRSERRRPGIERDNVHRLRDAARLGERRR
jgi:chromosome partitioning protein